MSMQFLFYLVWTVLACAVCTLLGYLAGYGTGYVQGGMSVVRRLNDGPGFTDAQKSSLNHWLNIYKHRELNKFL